MGLPTIDEMYMKFNISEELRENLRHLSSLDITCNKTLISLEIETHLINRNTDKILKKEIVNAELV